MAVREVARLLVAAVPYVALGYPWFAFFRDPWFEGGGLTVEQLQQGPGFGAAYTVAVVGSLVMAFILSCAIAASGRETWLGGVQVAFFLWLGFISTVLATQYVFEGRSLGYLGITAGYPLVGLLIMGAILGAWKRPSRPRP